LAEDERDQLMRWSRRAKSSQALALRSRIVLACAQQGVTNKQVAQDLGVTSAEKQAAVQDAHEAVAQDA
jgi:FixJ family two-component response regulator